MKFKVIFALIFTFIVSSCSSNNVVSYNEIDKNEKTITVPAGGGANAAIKVALEKNGWQLKIDSTSLKTVGSGGEKVNITSTVESDTRYRLLTSFETGSFSCLTCSCVRTYNMSIVDNKSGKEIASLDGGLGICYETLAEKVLEVLKTQ